MPRLYVSAPLEAGALLELSQEQAHFLRSVLRLDIGGEVRVFQEKSGEFLCTISALSKRSCSVEIGKQLREPCGVPDMWLLFAPVKRERNRFIAEKATELGAACLAPVVTARTTSNIRMDKLSAHIIEAAEQTERLDIPAVQEPIKLGDLLASWDERRTLIFADEAGGARPAADVLSNTQTPCAILVGPEGGFTADERALLRSKPFVVSICLGPRILRADTAALAVLTLWQALNGDWPRIPSPNMNI